jgi:hypothetical protein
MDDTLLRAAAHNNAVWCDAVCRALGGDTAFGDGLWVNRRPAPPYYSNAVTFNPTDTAAQTRGIRALFDAGLPDMWSVKDSFRTLDLAPLGFGVLFEARWLGLRPDQARRGLRPLPIDASAAHWQRVTTDAGLAAWETTWRGDTANTAAEARPRLFLPALLADPNLAFLAGYQDEHIVAVAAANRSDDGVGPVCGISNFFLPGADGETHRSSVLAGALSAARAAFPGLPLVGYERGDDLAAMRAVGFQTLGPLRVWSRAAP